MRSGNPAFSESTLLDLASGQVVSAAGADAGTMTVNGTVNKTGLLLLLVVITGAYSWSQAFGPTGEINPAINAYLWGGMLAGFGLALATIFKKAWAPVTAPLYAIAQGAPKVTEWYGAFGLMVTLVWLYLEFLRLLSKIQSR